MVGCDPKSFTLPSIKQLKNKIMGTIKIQTKKSISVSKDIQKWLNKKDAFFSTISAENFTNKEVVLTHLFLVMFIVCSGCVETNPLISFLSILLFGGCFYILNKKGKTDVKIRR